MTDPVDRLTTALQDRYRIERELGAGGMATVYLAEDLKHHRKVAIKVLRPELTATIGTDRFLKEIQVAARLNHPHILALHDSGDAAGYLYYVMPVADGESLRDRMNQERQLPMDEAIRITREVAAALDYAHRHGVIHRDIKPENVLLHEGVAMVTDFGIALAVSEAGGTRLTETGFSLGTPHYMSPEQSMGERDLDARSDVYALGCVLFEMLAGEPPFTGNTAQSIVAKRITESAPSVSTLRDTVPPWLNACVTRALARAPADRFDSAADFAAALAPGQTTAMPSASVSSIRHHPVRAAALFGMAAVLAGGLWASGVLGGGDDVAPGLPRLAVLPIENLGAPEDEYFADGVTEEITSRISDIKGLRVVSRTSAKRFKGSDVPIPEIGEALQVDYVLEGTLRTERDATGTSQVRVTSRLIKTSDDTQLWTESYTASLAPGKMFAVQADIAEQVAGALNVTLSEAEREAVRAVLTGDSLAYRLYQLGRDLLEDRSAQGLKQSQQLFHDAIARDSGFAAAHAGIADAISLYNYHFANEQGPTAWAPAEMAARQAVALDPSLAEAHASLGLAVMYGRWDWDGARESYQRAVELDADNAFAWYQYAEVDWVQGRLDSALAKTARAVDLDPLSAVANANHGISNWFVGNRQIGADLYARRTIDLQAGWTTVLWLGSWMLTRTGSLDEARTQLRRFFELDSSRPVTQTLVNNTLDVWAGRADLRTTVRVVEALESYGLGNSTAVLSFASAGIHDSAFARLHTSIDSRSESLPAMLNFYHDVLGDDPRWDPMLTRMGIVWE